MTRGTNRKSALIRALCLSAAMPLLLPASKAVAQCAPDAPAPGDAVTCSGTDPDGFTTALPTDDIAISVLAGAQVFSPGGGATDAAFALSGADVSLINNGSIFGTGSAHSISTSISDSFSLENNGLLETVDGSAFEAIVADNVVILNNEGGSIRSANGTSAINIFGGPAASSASLIENYGSIEALSGAGVTFQGDMEDGSFSVLNAGDISASGVGVDVGYFGAASNGVDLILENSGSIEGGLGNAAVSIMSFAASGSDTRVENSGLITAGGGLLLQDETVVVSNTQDGEIIALDADGIAVSIDDNTAQTDATVNNSGLILALGDDGVAVEIVTNSASVMNDGVIRAAGANGQAMVIGEGATNQAIVMNSGLIEAALGAIDVTTVDEISFGNSGQINGLVSLSTLGGVEGLIEFENSGGIDGDVVLFADRVVANNAGDIFGIFDASNVADGVALTNSGSIGDTLLSLGDDVVTQEAGGVFTGLLDGGIGLDRYNLDTGANPFVLSGDRVTGFEQIDKTGAGEMRIESDLALDGGESAFFRVSEGVVVLPGDASLSIGISVLDSGGSLLIGPRGVFQATGSITGNVFVDGVFQPVPTAPDSPVQIELSSFTMNPSGTLDIVYDGVTESYVNIFDDITLDGTINVRMAANPGFYSFTALQTEVGEIIGDFQFETITEGYTIEVVKRDGEVIINVGPVINPYRQLQGLQAASVNTGFAHARRAIDMVMRRGMRGNINNPDVSPDSPTGRMFLPVNMFDQRAGQSLIASDQAITLSNVLALNDAAKQIETNAFNAPSIQAVAANGLLPGLGPGRHNFRTIWVTPRTTAYSAASTSFGHYDNNSTQNGYDYISGEAVVGVDYYFTPISYAGIAAGFIQEFADFDLGAGELDTRTSGITLYGSHLTLDGYFANGAVNIGYSTHDLARNVEPGFETSGLTYADFHSRHFAAELIGGRDYAIGAWTAGLLGGVSYANTRVAAVSEFDEVDQSFVGAVEVQRSDSLLLSAGARGSFRNETEWGVLTLKGDVTVSRQMLDIEREIESFNRIIQIGGQTTIAPNYDDISVDVGLAANAVLSEQLVVSGYYDVAINQGVEGGLGHTIGILARIRL